MSTAKLIKIVRKLIKKNLSKNRFAHVQSVAQTCKSLSSKFNVSCEIAELVGLSHDLAREWPIKHLVRYALKSGYKPRKIELRKPILLHGRCAAIYLNKEFGINDKSILNALTVHTLGRKGMDLLAVLLYVSDYIEPTRRYISHKFYNRVIGLEPWSMVLEIHKHQKKRNKRMSSLTRELDVYAKKQTKEEINAEN